jgi:heterodisulfide reductase subunit B2
MSGFSYFPGCSLHATAREYDESIRAVAGLLGLELREIEDWCCCGATPAHALDPEAARILGFWNLAHAAKGGGDPVLTGCASCFSRLRAARSEMREHPDHAAQAAAKIGLPLNPGIEVLHIAQILASPEMREKITAGLKRPLKGLKVACYYGCLLTRPRGADAVDDCENPQILEDLVRLAGGEPIDWPLRLDCCGASMALPRPDVVRDLSGKILLMAHESGAQVLMVACPLCHSNMDFLQDAILRERGHSFRIPVLYLTELIGLAMGVAPDRLGLKRHFVPVKVEELIPAEEASRV